MQRGVLLLVATLVLLLSLAPASLLDQALNHASRGKVRLTDTAGSIWSGEGHLASSTDTESSLLNPWLHLSWSLQPGALMSGKLAWRINMDRAPALLVEAGLSGIELRDLGMNIPTAPLLSALPHPALQLGWQGRLQISSSQLSCGLDMECVGQLAVDWSHASGQLWPSATLGTFHAEVEAAPRNLILQLSSPPSNALRLDGTVHLVQHQRPQLSIDARGEDTILATLPGLLDGIARRLPDGSVALRLP